MAARALRIAALGLVLLVMIPTAGFSQSPRGIVLDQTGLALPGATVTLLDGTTIVATTTTDGDGAFEFDSALAGDSVAASLRGFQTVTMPRTAAARIVLPLARASETTEVVAPAIVPASPTAPLLGNSLSSATLARLPSSRLKARESLPLLPSIVRGADGLLRLGGARPHESPLLLDGFNVTDPATGTSSLNLPFEAVRGMQVLRDPMAVTFGGLLGGLVQLESNPGGAEFAFGLQGFIPRPRFANPGFGRIEGIFPRMFASGSHMAGRLRYFTAAEYDFERIPVPDVTQGNGPNIVEKSATTFGRVDLDVTPQNALTVEAFAFPSATDLRGLSTRRTEEAAPNLSATDLFAGVTDRHVFKAPSVLTIRAGVFSHDTTLAPNGNGPSTVSPAGFHGNWFSTLTQRATRLSLGAVWERTLQTARAAHDVTVSGRIALRRLRGSVFEHAVHIENDQRQLVRRIEFGSSSGLAAREWVSGLAVRDVWRPGRSRLQVDTGVRLDHSDLHSGLTPTARAGVRYAFDAGEVTVVKAGVGNFVGIVPLAAAAFSGFPARIDRAIDPETGETLSTRVFQPRVERLRQPLALGATFSLERRLTDRLDLQAGVVSRRSTRLATLDVPADGGQLAVRSNGVSTYREAQLSVRRTWDHEQQLFVSYVRSSSRGELNDFAALFQAVDVPLLRPGGRERLQTDAKHRWIAWGTFNLPRRVVVSPVVEWHSGFPYSVLDEREELIGRGNSRSFPAFFTLDLVTYKTFTAFRRSADLGIQLFNATDAFNPRDVYPVATSPSFGSFTNSVGPILRGFMMIKW